MILLLGALGKLPRVEPSTKKEGTHRRYFYGSVWAVTAAQTVLLVLWKALPQTQATSADQTGSLCWRAGADGLDRRAWAAAADAADSAGRGDGLGLKTCLRG